MGAFDFLTGGATDIGTGFGKSLDDPDFLAYLSGAGSKLSQGKGAGEALDISAFIGKKQADFAQSKRNIAAGEALAPAFEAAGTEPAITPTKLSDLPDVTPFGEAGPDEVQRTELTKADGTKSISTKTRAIQPTDAGQALAPQAAEDLTGADVGAALGGTQPVAQPTAQPVAQAPAVEPVQQGGQPLGDFLSSQLGESQFADLSPAETGNILSGLQAMRAQKTGDVVRDFEAGKVSTGVLDLPEEKVVERRDSQGTVIKRTVYDKPVDADGNQAALKGERYFDPVTNEYEWVDAGAAGPVNENARPVSQMLTADQVDKINNKSAELGARILSNKNLVTGEDVDLTINDKIPLISQFNSNPLGDSVILISPAATLEVDKVIYDPFTWDGEVEKDTAIYLVPKSPVSMKIATSNLEIFRAGEDPEAKPQVSATGEITSEAPSAPKGEVEAKQPTWKHIAKGPKGRIFSMDGENWFDSNGEKI